MTDQDPVDLIHLQDVDAEGESCIVRVTGRSMPGVLTGHDTLRAEILVRTGYVNIRLELFLSPHDLDTWQRELTELTPGGDASIGGDSGPSLGLHWYEDQSLSVMIADPGRLSAVLGIQPPEGWVDAHHQRLDRVRQSWPSEVLVRDSMTYEWRADREA